MTITREELWQEPFIELVSRTVATRAEGIDVESLRGGLESAICRVRVRFTTARGTAGMRWLVAKRLDGAGAREAAIHPLIRGNDFAPEMLGVVRQNGTDYLLLEYVRPLNRWPWQQTENTRNATRQLARIHAIAGAEGVHDWNYEAELAESAASTVRTIQEYADRLSELPLRASLAAVRRFELAMPKARREVERAFGTTLIHGDAHPGNAILRIRCGKPTAVFIDWARSRIGSPLEDVSSWLQTLRFWEPEAKRRHDSLLDEYLRARGGGLSATRELRDAYWVSAASNAMAGALRFQILRTNETSGRERHQAAGQATEWLRVLRRADACVRA